MLSAAGGYSSSILQPDRFDARQAEPAAETTARNGDQRRGELGDVSSGRQARAAEENRQATEAATDANAERAAVEFAESRSASTNVDREGTAQALYAQEQLTDAPERPSAEIAQSVLSAQDHFQRLARETEERASLQRSGGVSVIG